jgi:dihydroorotate dehydrogenase
VQVYTGLIYRGPSLVGECAAAIRELHLGELHLDEPPLDGKR